MIQLEALKEEDLLIALRRGVEELGIQASDEILLQIAAQSSGDARRALSILRIAPSVADGVLTQEVRGCGAHKRSLTRCQGRFSL